MGVDQLQVRLWHSMRRSGGVANGRGTRAATAGEQVLILTSHSLAQPEATVGDLASRSVRPHPLR